MHGLSKRDYHQVDKQSRYLWVWLSKLSERLCWLNCLFTDQIWHYHRNKLFTSWLIWFLGIRMRQQHNSVTVAPKYICNMAWGNPPPPSISLSFFLLFFNIKSWMHKMYRMFVHIKWWCCTDKKKLVTQVYHICHVARSEEDTVLTFMWYGPCSLRSKQVTINTRGYRYSKTGQAKWIKRREFMNHKH